MKEELKTLCAKILNWRNTSIYIIGLLAYALGVNMLVNANLGTSPLSSLAYVITCATGIRLSITLFGFSVTVLIIQRIVLGKDFEPTQYFQIIANFVFSLCTEITLPVAKLIIPTTMPGRVAVLLAGIIVLGVGVLFVKEGDILMLSGDGIGRVIHIKTRMPFGTAKTINDCLIVAIAIGVSLVTMGSVVGVQFGTVIAAVGVGIAAKYLTMILHKPIEAFKGKNNSLPKKQMG